MNARVRFWIAVVILLLLMTAPFLLTVSIVYSELPAAERAGFFATVDRWLPIGGLMTVVGFILGLQLLRALFDQYVRGLLAVAEKLRLMHEANRSFRVESDGPPEVRALTSAANALAEQRDELLADVEARVARAKAAVEEEKNRLAALVADLPQPVIVCNLDGRILLYNNRARLQTRALSRGAPIGLGRSIDAVFDRALIGHALETLQHRLERSGSQPLAHFVTTTQAGQLIRVQMAPVIAAQEEEGAPRSIGGYVLTMENISRFLEHDAQCDLLMQHLADDSRAAMAGVRAGLRELAAGGGAAKLGPIEAALDQLSLKLDAASNQYAESMKTRWPLEEMLAGDLVAAAQRRIEARVGMQVRIDEIAQELWVKVDSFSLTQAIAYLAAKLDENYGTRLVRLRAASAGTMVHLDLLWAGTAVSTEILLNWQLDPMHLAGESSPLTLRDVTDRHGGQLTCGRDKAAQMSMFRIEIPVALVHEPEHSTLIQVESRPEFYDFDLFHRTGEDHALDDRRLAELAYTAFDTETTGLEPSAGDEIIQIGAVRIVNGRMLRHETMDQLIDPRRPLKQASIAIHGITEEMVAGQPPIGEVLPQFHAFAEDTVLVAHNAAFDMRFLQLKEEATGVSFTQPVLDTLLLSAVIHPNQELHKLEAIAERLGIPIIGRHNALGDAFVTGEVFLKMIPLLAEMGIHTLRQAREAAEKTYYARVKY
jgi:DNA polymerase-3 subunit epsilon